MIILFAFGVATAIDYGRFNDPKWLVRTFALIALWIAPLHVVIAAVVLLVTGARSNQNSATNPSYLTIIAVSAGSVAAAAGTFLATRIK